MKEKKEDCSGQLYSFGLVKEESAKKRFTKAQMSADTFREKLQGYLKQERVDGVIPEIVGDEGMRFLVPIGIAGDF